MAMLLASMLSIGQMAKNNELAAIKSAGISMNSLFMAVFAFALFVSAAALVFAEKVVPASNKAKTRIEERYLGERKARKRSVLTNVLVRDALNRRVFISKYNTRTKVANRITIQSYDGNLIRERVDIKSMRWREGKWVLESGYRRVFAEGLERAEPLKDTTDSNLTFTPAELTETQAAPEDMSYGELRRFIRDVIRNGGDPRKWQVDLNFKLSIPLANFVLVLFGAPLASNKRRSGAIFGLILSSVVFLLYFGVMRFVQTLGQLGKLPPVTAAWMTNAVFAALALLVLVRARR